MQVDRYLRLAFVLSNNQATTLRKNLQKMISLVLYDEETGSDASLTNDLAISTIESSSANGSALPVDGTNKKEKAITNSIGLGVVDIISRLSDSYGLDFSESEILDAIKNQRSTAIITLSGTPKRFALSPDAFNSIRSKVSNVALDDLLKSFIAYREGKYSKANSTASEEKICAASLSEDAIRKLLYKYLYTLFNSNASYISGFLGKDYETINLSDTDFSLAERCLVNDFLYWDNPEKDRVVYEMVSCCLDYCMMTVKKDASAYKSIFNNKIFYLDTNIIFRLIGINRESRKRVITAFIKKCSEVHITLKVTNFTRKEIDDTISINIEKIKKVLGSSAPISVSNMLYYASAEVNPDFYNLYREWKEDPTNYGTYQDFEKELKRRVQHIYTEFGIKRTDCESLKEEQGYNDKVTSLIEYKQNRHRNASESSAQIDVSNYLFVRGLNAQKRKEATDDFFNIHHYLISADHTFGDWAREQIPNSIPIVVLPSVWYSIILQYAGRNTSDDYAAFTRFLNFSLGNGEHVTRQQTQKKLDILKKVLQLREPPQIKDELLLCIEEKFKNHPDEADDYSDVDQIVEEGMESLTEQKVREAREAEQRKAEAEKKTYTDDYNNKMQLILNKHEAEINILQNDLRLKEIKDKDNRKLLRDQREQMLEEETAIRTQRRLMLYRILTVIIAIGFFVIVVAVFHWIDTWKGVTDKLKTQYDWLKYIIGLAGSAIGFFLIKPIFCDFDYQKLYDNIRRDVEREHSENNT